MTQTRLANLAHPVDTEYGIISAVAGSGKTLQKMRQNAAGWRIQDLITVAENSRIDWRQPGRGGSHVIFSARGVREVVSVPDKRPIKAIYVRQFVALIDAAAELAADSDAKGRPEKSHSHRNANIHERQNHKTKS